MLIAEVTRGPRGGVKLLGVLPLNVARREFLIIDGQPVRYIADDGTLLGVRRFVWGDNRREMLAMARERAQDGR